MTPETEIEKAYGEFKFYKEQPVCIITDQTNR